MSEQPENDATITVAEACQVADCPPSTLRAWHNRLGFLPRENGGWRRYSLSDVLAVRLLVILTKNGREAAKAIDIVHTILPEIKKAAHGIPTKVAIGRVGPTDALQARRIDPLSRAMDALDFDGEETTVFDLGRINLKLVDAIRAIRRKPTVANSVVGG